MDRRTFVTAAAMTGAVASTTPSAGRAVAHARRAGSRLIVNALGRIENPNLALTRPPKQNPVDTSETDVDDRAIRDTIESGCSAVNVTLGYVGGPMEPFEFTIRTIGIWDEIVRAHPHDLLKVYTAADIVRAQSEHRVGVIYGFQNAAMVGNDAKRVDIFADLGVKIIQLTYNPRNQLGDGSMVAENKGLTDFGREVVARLNAKRVMVDLSHSGEHTCLDAARASTVPISINHTGCRALTDLPRNKTDEELRLVASKGGFVGIYFMPFLTLDGHPHADDVVAHIEHAVNVCGEDHVGIGTDAGSTSIDDLQQYQTYLAHEIEARRAAGLGAAGERPDTYPFVVDLRGPDQFRKLAGLLEKRGYTAARIDKILGKNFLRFASDIWGA